MDRHDELDRSHGEDDRTRSWSTSSQFGVPEYYGYNSGDLSILHRDAIAHSAAPRDLRARRGLCESSHHQALFTAARSAAFHETWPPDGGMMMQEPSHMAHAPGSYHSGHPQQHSVPSTAIPFPSYPINRPSMQGLPGFNPDEADRALQTLLAAAGLNAAPFPNPAPLPTRPHPVDPSPHYYPLDPPSDQFLATSQGIFPQSANDLPPGGGNSLPFMMPSSSPHPAAALPPSTHMWAHTYPASGAFPNGHSPADMGMEAPFPPHVDRVQTFQHRHAHTLPFPSPTSSPTAGQQRSPPAPSVASAPAAGGAHSSAAYDAPSASTAPDHIGAAGAGTSMFQIRQQDRSKTDASTASAPLPGAGWGGPSGSGDMSGGLSYDCLSLPTIHESAQPQRGSFSGALSGGHLGRGGQGPNHPGSGVFGSPPASRRLQPQTHDSFRSNASGSFKSTSSVNTSFRSGYASFRSDSFHHDPEAPGADQPDGRDSSSAAAAAAVAAAAAPPPPAGRGVGLAMSSLDELPPDAPAPAGAATDMSRWAVPRPCFFFF